MKKNKVQKPWGMGEVKKRQKLTEVATKFTLVSVKYLSLLSYSDLLWETLVIHLTVD